MGLKLEHFNFCSKKIGRNPTDPGKQWGDAEMRAIRWKLRKIWENAVEVTQLFDPSYGNEIQKYKEFLYDPKGDTTINDCKPEKQKNSNCEAWWGEARRSKDIAFSERKMLRLAFHDCFLYENGTGGCDGCLNLDENVGENDGLQFSVAVLEAIYTDKDFPTNDDLKKVGVERDFHEDEPKLDKSPRDLGYSRADLWAFAGLVALDEFQTRTRQLCFIDKHAYSCDQTECFSPFDQTQFEAMFKSGRRDCEPRFPDNPKLGYVASEKERTPNQHGNGEDSVEYFERDFKLGPREGLALLGVHTVGKFNPMTAHNDYAWVRDRGSRQELFNNEYYQMMTLMPSRIKTRYCTGNMCKLYFMSILDTLCIVFFLQTMNLLLLNFK